MSDYILNPYQGNILPGTTGGAKLYLAATKGITEESKRLQLSLDNALEIKEHCLKASHTFGWETLINVPHNYAGDGTPQTLINMLHQPERTSMEMVRVQAAITWNRVDFNAFASYSWNVLDIDPENHLQDRIIFQRRVRSEMISAWIDNSFNEAALATIKLDEHLYTWQAPNGRVMEDGPTKLKLILDDIQPAKIVGADVHRQRIQNARLEKYSHNVKDAMEDIMRNYKEILRVGESYDSLRLSVFNCLRSTKNSTYKAFVERVEQDVSSNSGAYNGYTPQMIMATAVSEYKNMEARDVWNKLDPHQAQMAALLTIAAKNSSTSNPGYAARGGGRGGGGGGGGGGGTGGGTGSRTIRFEAWQTEFKGDTIVRNGKTWWFCKKHNDGKGLYVRHPPGDHDAWAESKKKMKDTGARYPEYKPPDPLFQPSVHAVDGAVGTPEASSNSTLELGEELKQVLASFGMSSNDAQEAWNLAKDRASKND
jgi:hypothetical protein